MTKIDCPNCGRTGTTDRVLRAGKTVRCPACQCSFPYQGADVDPLDFLNSPPTPARSVPDSSQPAAVLDAVAPDTVDCYYCGEPIRRTARKCKHCGEFLDPDLRKSAPPQPQAPPQQVIVRDTRPIPKWSPGVAAVLSLVIPGAGQMYKGNVGSGLLWLICVVIGYMAFIVPGLVLHLLCIVAAASGDPMK